MNHELKENLTSGLPCAVSWPLLQLVRASLLSAARACLSISKGQCVPPSGVQGRLRVELIRINYVTRFLGNTVPSDIYLNEIAMFTLPASFAFASVLLLTNISRS